MAVETRKRVYGFGKSIWNDGHGWILLLVSYGWLLVLGSRLVFPAVLPYIRQEFSLTHTTAGFVITSLWLGYAFTQFPSGILSDKYGEMRVLLVSSLFGLVALSLVVLRDPVFSIAAVMFFSSFAYQGLIGFYPTYLIEVKQISPSTAALVYSLFFACGVVCQLLSGGVSDRIGKATTIMFIALINCTGLVLLTFANDIYEIGAITVMLSVSLGIWPVTGAYAVAALPSDIEGSAFGLLRTAFLALAATSPSIVGSFFDRGLFDSAFFVLATATAVSAVVCFRLRYKHDME